MWKKIYDERIRFCIDAFVLYCASKNEEKHLFETLPQACINAINECKNFKLKTNYYTVEINFEENKMNKTYTALNITLKKDGKYVKYTIPYTFYCDNLQSNSFSQLLMAREIGQKKMFGKENKQKKMSFFIEPLGPDVYIKFYDNIHEGNECGIRIPNFFERSSARLDHTEQECNRYDKYMYKKNHKEVIR